MKKKNTPPNNLAEKYFDVAEVMLVVINADQTVCHINKKGCNILGYQEEEVIGKNWFDNFLSENIREETKKVFDKLMAGKMNPVEYHENLVMTKSGEEKLIAWHNTVLKDEKGKVICAISSGANITERRRIDAEILSISKFPSENLNPVLRINSDKTILYMNEAFGDLLISEGLPQEDALEILPENLYSLIDSALQSGSPHIMVEVNVSDRVISYNIVPVPDHGYVNLYGRDITDHKKAQDQLINKEKFLINIFDSIQDGISILDSEMNIIRVNKAMERWYSHAMPLVGEKCYMAYHGRRAVCNNCPSYKTLKGGKCNYSVVPKTGIDKKQIGWIALYSFPLFDDKTGEIKGVIEYVRDISERMKFEKELQKKVEDLERFYDMAVGRELKMKELKKKVKELKMKLSSHEKD